MNLKENKLIGGGDKLKSSHNHGLGGILMRCLDAKTHRGKVVFGNKNILSLGGESGCLNEVITTMREGKNLAASLLSRLAAFTLAEVLVTLGIIGVVSAMTVPTLMQNYQRQSYVTQLHKVYNEMSQALLRYQTDRNAVNLTEAGLTSQDAFINFMKTYFKNVKECDTMDSCFAPSYKKMSGVTMGSYDSNNRSFVLASGATIRTGGYDPVGTKLFNIGVDVNGLKGPNIVGRDFFWIYIYNNGMIDDEPIDANTTAPFTAAQRETQFHDVCSNSENNRGGGCLGKILNDNWQMNY